MAKKLTLVTVGNSGEVVHIAKDDTLCGIETKLARRGYNTRANNSKSALNISNATESNCPVCIRKLEALKEAKRNKA